jgi:cell division protein ZapE
VAAGELAADPAQLESAGHLDRLAEALANWRPGRRLLSFVAWPQPPPRGLYIHGAVGRGKTMLMDLFHASVDFTPKRRVHFHAFMADVHDRIRMARGRIEGDPVPHVARDLAQSARLLCFDELHVTDIADAMILGRLFAGFFAEDVVVVATSNAHPADLYRDGLNRQLFLPFIDLIAQNLDVLELAAAKDYRLEKLAGEALYFTPADAAAAGELDRLWLRLTGAPKAEPAELTLKGRKVSVPRAAMGVARFRFTDLCEKPLGTLDYLEIAHAFHTVMIDAIPVLGPGRRNEARRLVNLVDTLYDARVCLIASAAAEPAALYPEGDGAEQFVRTASRLIEMRSAAYLAGRAHRLAPSRSGVTPL